MAEQVKVSLCVGDSIECEFRLKKFCFIEMLGGSKKEVPCIGVLEGQHVSSPSREGEVSGQNEKN